VRHVLPNALGPVIVAGSLEVAAAIILESTLSFLGLGFPPDIPTWGRILFDAKDNLDFAPHWAIFPGTAIFLAVLSINFIGDGLREGLDPRRVLGAAAAAEECSPVRRWDGGPPRRGAASRGRGGGPRSPGSAGPLGTACEAPPLDGRAPGPPRGARE